MHEPDFWTSYADAMELSIEGSRLIAQEIADSVRNLLHRLGRSFDDQLRNARHNQHLPPV